MAMVDVDVRSLRGLTDQVGWLGLRVGVHLALSLQLRQMKRMNVCNGLEMMTVP